MINKLICTIYLGLALCQWVVIGERAIHAFWMHKKFEGFSGVGYTTMSLETIVTGYIGSALMIVVAVYVLRRNEASGFCSKSLKTAAIMLCCGLVGLTILLLSPYAVVVRR